MLMVGAGPIGGIIGGRLARAGHGIAFVDVDKEPSAQKRGQATFPLKEKGSSCSYADQRPQTFELRSGVKSRVD